MDTMKATMRNILQSTLFPSAVVCTLALLIAGCASQAAEATPAASTATSTTASNAAPLDDRTALACTISSNCVNSFGTSGLAPLRFEGTPAQAIAALRATLADFPEAKIVRTDDLAMEVVFTTTVGFKDLVDFKIDAQAQRINYRSRSSFGLFDFGKNRSRMEAFTARFEQVKKR